MKLLNYLIPLIPVALLYGCTDNTSCHTIELKYIKADGTPPRTEREFKYSLQGNLNIHDLSGLAIEINKVLTTAVDSFGLWQAPAYTEINYYTDNNVASFAFMDVCFDTENDLNYKNAVVYRLRERFKSLKRYRDYVQDQSVVVNWPYRIEFQAKTDRKELGGGLSIVSESRFEFRKQSPPFSKINLPPPPPWDLDEFIGYLQEGRYKTYYTWPAKSIVNYFIPERTNKNDLVFKPKLILIIERHRQHINMRTPWGSGPNPEQAFIISLDNTWVYNGPVYLEFLEAKKLGKDVIEPELKGNFVEIEIEFERNVSGALDRSIQEIEDWSDNNTLEWLKKARDAFLNDQETIMKIVRNYFKGTGVIIKPIGQSKYRQAYEMLEN